MPLRRAAGDEVQGQALLDLQIEQSVDHQAHDLLGALDVDDGRTPFSTAWTAAWKQEWHERPTELP